MRSMLHSLSAVFLGLLLINSGRAVTEKDPLHLLPCVHAIPTSAVI